MRMAISSKRMPFAGFFQNPSRDLDALAPLARRGKPDELAAALTFGRRLCGKQMTRKPRQIGIAVRLASLQLDAALLELRDRAHVAVGNGDERVRRALHERPEKLRFGLRLERHVEQQHGHRRPTRYGASATSSAFVAVANSEARSLAPASAISVSTRSSRSARSGPLRSNPRQWSRCDPGQPQFLQRAREGFGKTWSARNGREVIERFVFGCFERRACGDGFVAER